MMTVETGLNLIWAWAAAAALVVFAVHEWRCRRGEALSARCRRGVAVFVAAVALFPSISVSDDLVRFEGLRVGPPAASQVTGKLTAPADDGPGLYLARLSDALENSQVASVCWLLVTLFCFALVGVQLERGRDRSLPSFASRAPPFSVSLA